MKPIRIGLLWHSANSGNLGVGALTLANVAMAREAAAELGLNPSFLIIGMRGEGCAYAETAGLDRFGVDTRALFSPTGCWTVFGELDCVLDIGMGDSFAEIYGPKRFAFLLLSKFLVLARHRPLLLSPQTIGPLTLTPYRQLASMVLGRARAVVARDPASFEAIGHLSRSARAVLAIDVAFALPFEDQSARRGGERLRLGVNVSGLLFNEATSGRNRFGLQADYSELMRRFIASRAKRPDVEVHLLAHVTGAAGSWDDDSAVADALAEEFPAAIRAPRFAGPSEAKSYISGLDFLVAGRMHACIAAFSSSVPVVPVAYSRKFSGLFGMLDYPWMVPVRGADTDQALAYLEDCVERRSELAADVRRGMERVDAYLDAYRAELRTFLGSVAASVAAAS